MKWRYQHFDQICVSLLGLIGLIMVGGLSSTILYQVLIAPSWCYHTHPGHSLFWICLIR